jgi:hypothetical protein
MKSLKILLMLSGSFAILCAGVALLSLSRTIDALPKLIDRHATQIRIAATDTITAQSAMIREDLRRELADTRKLIKSEIDKTIPSLLTLTATELDKTIPSLLTLTATELDKTRETIQSMAGTIDRRVAAIQEAADLRLASLQADSNAQLSRITGQLEGTLKPINLITDRVGKALPDFLDCYNPATGKGNPDCLFNRWVGMGRGIESTAGSIAKISSDISTLTHNAVKPVPWWRRILGDLEAGAIVGSKFIK